MEHFAPHPKANFEGWYSKFDLASGAHIALIICSVPNASSRRHMVSFTYIPACGDPIFQREHFVDNIQRITTDESTKAFEVRVPGMGFLRAASNGTTCYEFEGEDKSWRLDAQSDSHRAWSAGKNTPEGWMIHLPLPLHWHVHSLCSPCTVRLAIPSLATALPAADRTTQATVHQEKNWATSFPTAHMWVQAWDASHARGVCLAGGKILHNTAYLLGYRSPSLTLDFAPPFSIAYLHRFSPFLRVRHDWPRRRFTLRVANLSHRLELTAQAPVEHGWFGLASPFPDGHRVNYCRENFGAVVETVVSKRRGGWWPWSGWEEVARHRFEGASLEFAGEYYPERGGGGGREEGEREA